MLRSPVRSTTGPGLLDLSANRCCPVGEDSSASSSRVGWGRSPRNSLKLCTIVLCLISCKREAPPSKGDTSGVSAKGTPMLKSAFFMGSGTRMTLMGCILSDPVLVRVASTVLVRLGGEGWRQGRSEDKYSNR
ncbi:hypothetical protein TIFTF001_013956 [Ficus carica]|uniref:Uncharacterized protein n=1 Tax=Ficus carica TaxID=3494 RepID=A0AA88AIT3_FICCA|nr:hypothetical protein TIFTF001_013956 [Ficus carica]